MDHFLIACLLMGLGIGVDVAIATALRARSLRQQNMTLPWIGGVSLTHTLFPMVGYLVTYFSLQSLPAVTPVIGVLAAGLIIWFLWGELIAEQEKSESQQLMVTIGIILAVSWDALWSGPAKSAQVEGWSELMVWMSFLLVGLIVLLFAIFAFRLGLVACNRYFQNSRRMVVMLWLQYSVIGYFALLALAKYTFAMDFTWWALLMMSMAIIAVVMALAGSMTAQQKSTALP
jgi:MFS family permease